ncbi:MAG: hypothetical protein AAFO85_07230 [Cyanobacteria bacterium J06598_4]
MAKPQTDRMNSLFTLKTVLKTLVGASIASGLMALPVKANEDNLADRTFNSELIFSQNFSDNAETTDDFNKIVGLTGLAIGTGVIGYHLSRADKPSLVNSIPAPNRQSTSLLDRLSPKLRRELLRLVHNRQTASRLLAGTLTSHPGRSPNWVAEKVIYDLKRDR